MAKVNKKDFSLTEWVDNIIIQGVNRGASDIHFDPFSDKAVVRFRIDGLLHGVETTSLDSLETIIARLKVMAQLNTTEKRKPQDGHILFQSDIVGGAQPMDLRLSIFPTVSGEAAVIRILSRKDFLFESLEKLGMSPETADNIRSMAQKPSGMILATGPGGSGKSSTLYTILNHLKEEKPQKNIITLEDPVEIYLEGVRQSQIHPEIGFTFAEGLKSILRQDPNVIMVGEIRDDETAEISVRAALMGSLFFSTMHTINSVGAIVRFTELGLSRSLIASSLLVVIAQRLVRTICPHCKEEIIPDKKLLAMSGIGEELKISKLYHGKGCDACSNSGYIGRTGVFEVMFINKEIQELIMSGASFNEIENYAKKNGMKTLRQAAIQKAIDGITTLEEAIRVTPL